MFGEDSYTWGQSFRPWRELSRLQDEVNRLFSGIQYERPTGYPRMRIWTHEDGVVVHAELPGLSAKEIDISVLGDSLTVSGKREAAKVENATYHRRERDVGQFTRTFQMPFRIEAEKVRAEFKNGVLELNLPRATSDKPKRITVKAN